MSPRGWHLFLCVWPFLGATSILAHIMFSWDRVGTHINSVAAGRLGDCCLFGWVQWREWGEQCWLGSYGTLDGGPQCPLSNLRNGCLLSLFSNFHVDFKTASCRISNLRNGLRHVNNIFSCVATKAQCRMSLFRNCCVTLSNLRVKGHSYRPMALDP